MAIGKQDKKGGITPLIESFPPVASPQATTLILGSMPGIASLEAGQYYAHPRNLFWKVIEDITGTPHQAPYQDRIKQLEQSGIALWDVLKSCTRTGSLDSDIRQEEPNDLKAFLHTHKQIRQICFNGKKAESVFKRYLQTLENAQEITADKRLTALPSTSPANASIPYEIKLKQWREALLPPL